MISFDNITGNSLCSHKVDLLLIVLWKKMHIIKNNVERKNLFLAQDPLNWNVWSTISVAMNNFYCGFCNETSAKCFVFITFSTYCFKNLLTKQTAQSEAKQLIHGYISIVNVRDIRILQQSQNDGGQYERNVNE